MLDSLIFNEEAIIKSSSYKPAVTIESFLVLVEKLTAYEQDYNYQRVVDLEKAEEIIMNIQSIMRKENRI